MPFYNGLLMRDTTTDTGVVPSPGYPYSSPDIIAHDQVANPQAFFTGNWSSDPNQPVQLGSQSNPVYVRGQNLSTTTLSGWSISLYRANSSLFMRPSIWRNNRMMTLGGQAQASLNDVQPNAVVVGNDYFLLDAVSSNLFCLIGIASSTPNPTIPSDFSTYNDYVMWVQQNQNVCGRNLTTVRNFPNRQYERIDSFSNPQSDPVPTLFRSTVVGSLPVGTTFGLTCSPLGINTSWNISQGNVQTASGMCPGGFNGSVTSWASLPSGVSQWPSGARIDTSVYVGLDAEAPATEYAAPPEEHRLSRDELRDLVGDTGRLVLVGDCSTLFVTG